MKTKNSSNSHRLQFLNQPRPTRVTVDSQGMPQWVTVNGRRRRVTTIRDAWRIDDEWWRPAPLQRLYFALVLDGGAHICVYRDLCENRWLMQRY
jgi:hypothetical protein